MIKERRTSYLAYELHTVPFIRISGKWLERIGFGIGSKFILKISDNALTLIPTNSTSVKNSSQTDTNWIIKKYRGITHQ